MKKIVTIIISHLNSNNQLEECLRSISLKCFVGQLKVLVQDGNSKDPVQTIIDLYSEILDIQLFVQPDKGIYDAWNKALKEVDTEYVCFLGADDRLTDEWQYLLKAASTGTDNFITGRGLMKKDAKYLQIGAKSSKFMWPIMMNVVHSGSIFKSEYINKSLFCNKTKVAGDYIHLLKNKKHVNYKFVNRVVVVMDGGGISQQQGTKGQLEILNFLKKQAKITYVFFALKLRLRKVFL